MPVRVGEDLHRRVSSRRAHDAAAWMSGRAAHVQVADRRAVLRPARRGTQEEQLFERQLALEDVPFRQPPFALEVERSDDLTMANDVADVGRVLRERVDDRVAERLALLVPRAVRPGDTARTARSTTSRACPAAPRSDR